VLAGCVAIVLVMALNHRNAGRQPEATLTHEVLTAANMDGMLSWRTWSTSRYRAGCR
jgi:hypothetical protein